MKWAVGGSFAYWVVVGREGLLLCVGMFMFVWVLVSHHRQRMRCEGVIVEGRLT